MQQLGPTATWKTACNKHPFGEHLCSFGVDLFMFFFTAAWRVVVAVRSCTLLSCAAVRRVLGCLRCKARLVNKIGGRRRGCEPGWVLAAKNNGCIKQGLQGDRLELRVHVCDPHLCRRMRSRAPDHRELITRAHWTTDAACTAASTSLLGCCPCPLGPVTPAPAPCDLLA